MILNRATFAKKHGVSRAAVTKAVERGLLNSRDDGAIDEADQINKKWINNQKAKKMKPQQEAEKIPAPFEGLPDIESDPPDVDSLEDIGALQAEKMRAEIRLKREQEQAYRIKRLQEMGILVEREEVRKTLGRFNAELRIRLLELPGTISARIVSGIKTGQNEHDIEVLLSNEIGRAIDAAKLKIKEGEFE